MASWNVFANLQNGQQLQLNATDHIWLNGTAFGLNVVAGQYQNSTHVSDQNDVQRDITSPVNNTQYLSGSTVSYNSGPAIALSTISGTQSTFQFQFVNGSAVATSAATFFAYDGVTLTNPMVNVTFQAAEAGNSSWTAANGSGAALSLGAQSAGTVHNFNILLSASPNGPGAVTGSVQLQLTYA